MADSLDAITFSEAHSLRFLFRGQLLHALAAIVFASVAWALATPSFGGGMWLGVADAGWFWAAVGLGVVHQLYGWLVFRGQLGWGIFTRWFGQNDLTVHAILFISMLVARPLVILGAGLADPTTLALPRWVELTFGFVLLVPAVYTGWSVARYFGLKRALGGDHFRRVFREMPLVEDGAFRWTPNAMYTFAFLGLWSIAFILGSHVALVAALFQHAFVWAHYLATEYPDMELIYGE